MLRSTCHALLLLLIACRPATDDGPAGAVTVRDSAGVAIVENHRPILPDAAWQLTPEPVLSLPDSVATGGAPFVREAKRLSNGDILVLGMGGVRWLDSTGGLIRTIATQGEGPGEFKSPGGILVLPGDTVLVDDEAVYAMKTARWAPDGSYLDEQRVDGEKFNALGHWVECLQPRLPDGSRLGCQHDPNIPVTATNRPSLTAEGGWSDPGPGLLRQLKRRYVVSPTLDTAYPLGLDMGIESYGVDVGGRTQFVLHPLHAWTRVAFGGQPLRIAIATNPEWRVEVWTTTGRLERVILLDGGRSAATPREQAIGDSLMREQELRRARDTIATEKVLAQVPTPDSTAGIMDMAVAPDGHLAIARGGLFAAGFPITIDFIDPSGRWVASKQLPARWRLLDFGRDYLLGVRYDEDDLPHVEMYGLRRQQMGAN